MTFVDAAAERTTAATDLVLAAIALLCLVRVWRARAGDGLGRSLWTGVFGLVGISAVLGAAAHGLVMTPRTNFWLWQYLNLALGLAVAFFAGAAAGDTSGRGLAVRVLPPALAACGVSLFFSFLYPSSFLSFIVYEGAVTLFALWLYLRATTRGGGSGARRRDRPHGDHQGPDHRRKGHRRRTGGPPAREFG